MSTLTNQAPRAAGEAPNLGILFVHGIGDQRRGQTLADFGTPLVDWLAGRAEQFKGSVGFAHATLEDEDAPANVEVRIDREGQYKYWLLAETWWAESFAPRSFRELATWTFSVIPWTFGSHFGRRVSRAWRAQRSGWAAVKWLFNILVSLIAMLFGVALSLPIMGVFSVMLIITLIPWRRLQASIQSLQLRLASTLGDSLIFVNRPIETAAIITRFQRDLDWLLQQQCERVAVVAHSQGAAIAVRALSARSPDRVKLLITFGSGLRKLEELEVLRRNRSLRLGANLTLFGLVVVGWQLAFTVAFVLSGGQRGPLHVSGESLGILLLYGLVGFALLIFGFRDFFRDPTMPSVAKRATSLEKQGVGWKDFFASSDPVPNGALRDDHAVVPESVEVINRGSMLRDHTNYWNSRDDFVARVADALIRYDEPAALPPLDPAVFSDLAKRRRRRVRLLVASGWLGAASMLALFFKYASDWGPVLRWLLQKGSARVASIFGATLHVDPAPKSDALWRTLGWFALIWVAQFAVRQLWSVYDRRVTEYPPPYWYEGNWGFGVGAAIWLQLIVIAIAWLQDVPPSWYFFLSMGLYGVCLVSLITNPAAGGYVSKVPREEIVAGAEAAGRTLWGLVQMGLLAFAWFSIISKPVRWLRGAIIQEFKLAPDSVVATIAGWAVAGVVITILFYLGRRSVKKEIARKAAQAPVTKAATPWDSL